MSFRKELHIENILFKEERKHEKEKTNKKIKNANKN